MKKPPIILHSKPQWLPDWRNGAEYNLKTMKPKNYPSPRDPRTTVAWEFLRRNQKYNEQYNLIKEALLKEYASCNDDYKIKNLEEGIVNLLISKDGSLQKRIIEEAAEWGLMFYADPTHREQAFLSFRLNIIVPNINSVFNQFFPDFNININPMPLEVPPGYSAVLFNMQKPIAPQIEYAAKSLEATQKTLFPKYKPKRNNFKKENLDLYKRLLRLLDALISEERPKNIKELLYAGQKFSDINDKYKKDKLRAIELVDGGYKDLVMIY